LARRPAAGTAPLTDVGPDSTVAGLDEREIAVVRRLGMRWGRALAGRHAWLRALPVDPGVLMVAVGFSYRQLIRAYPHGGGSYVVAHETRCGPSARA
jgi:hypothetical protein